MVKKFKTFESRPIVFGQSENSAMVALTNEAKLSIYKKSQKSGYSTAILEEVYHRGISAWDESSNKTAEQFAFDRVNSFVAGGLASKLDEDLVDEGVSAMFDGSRDAKGVIKHLSQQGIVYKRSGGEHTIYHHPSVPEGGNIEIPNHRGDLSPGVLTRWRRTGVRRGALTTPRGWYDSASGQAAAAGGSRT